MRVASKYSFELWSPLGTLTADLSGIANGRSFTRSRNEADQIDFTMDFGEYHELCELINTHPRALIVPGQTEVRVRRGDKYISGGQVIYPEPDLGVDSKIFRIRSTGFLNLLASRYTGSFPSGAVTESFTSVQGPTIAATLINDTQALTNGDYGITVGTLATSGVHNRNYDRTNIKTALQSFTKLQTGSFDFDFTPDKVFNTYVNIGSSRPEVYFEYPGNITRLRSPLDATAIANEVIALGAGIGSEALVVEPAYDTPSQLGYKLRQKIVTANGTTNEDGAVTDTANAELAAWKVPFEVPAIVVDGNQAPIIGDYDIGDYVRVKVSGYKWFDNLDGMFRIEKYTVDIDDDDNELVTLYLAV